LVKGHAGVRAVGAGWGLECDFPVRGRTARAREEMRLDTASPDVEKGTVIFVLVGWGERNEAAMKKVRERVGEVVQREGCVAWDAFRVQCEVLERIKTEN